MGAAWLCTHLWTHYEYTLDREFLERSYPIMCEAALFFIDFLVERMAIWSLALHCHRKIHIVCRTEKWELLAMVLPWIIRF